MPEKRTCSSCGAELAGDARGGLCVPCALQRMLDDPQRDVGQVTSQSAPLAQSSTQPFAVTEKIGDQLGHYALLEQLGEGGCGIVYLAEQQEPVRRRVALKVIKPGMDSRHVLARFEAERQALALMDHVNIAKVLDAGATPAGRPYFVMEWVKGVRITEYCDRAKLPTRERLKLFIQVCHAIQHAHHKGVIHRDIKPSNILVTLQDGVALPKVIDFGIAKATTGQSLTDKTIFTALEQFIGTPAYMSPEQAELTGLDIDTRSDIYALGVLLYELLTGKTPFEAKDLMARGLDEIRRVIREQDPPRPSTRLSTLDARERTEIAARRQAEPPALLGMIRGDLDWVVMKALEKERNRRYESANALAVEIQRFLDDEVVLARPPSNIYRFRKLIRRNKLAFAGGLAVSVLLVAGVTLATIVFVQKKLARQALLAEQQKAAQQEAIANAVRQFLVEDLLTQASSESQADAAFKPNPDLTVREALERAGKTVGTRFKDLPQVEAAVQSAIGDTLVGLGQAERSLPHLQRAVELLRTGLGPDNEDTRSAIDSLAQAYQEAGKIDQALPLFEENLKWGKAKLGPQHASTFILMNNLASAYRQAGRFSQAVALYEETLNLKKAVAPDDPGTLRTMGNLAVAYQYAGDLDKAVPMFEATLKLEQAKMGPEHPNTLSTMNNLAGAYREAGKFDQARSLLEQTLKLQKASLGPDHPSTLKSMNALATACQAAGQFDQALSLLTETHKLQKAKLGPEHPDTLNTMGNLASVYQDVGKLQEAVALLEDTLKLDQAKLGLDNVDTLITMHHLALACEDSGEIERAASLFSEASKLAKARLGPDHPVTHATLSALGSCMLSQSNYPAAETLLRQEYESRKAKSPDDWRTFSVQSHLGMALLGLKRYSEAEPLLSQGYQGLKDREPKIPAANRVSIKQAGARLVQLYLAWGKPEQANQWKQRLNAEAKPAAGK